MLGVGCAISSSGKRVKNTVVSVLEFITTASLPPFLTYTRNDTTAMYRNADGSWSKGTAHTPFLHHDLNGNSLGLWIERAATNKCTNINWQMGALTNVTEGGNASGTVSIGTHPVHGFPTLVIDNTLGGSGTKHATFEGTFANTNPHSMRVEFYVETGNNGGDAFINDNGEQGTVAGSSSIPVGQDGTIKSENFTPSLSTRKMRVNAGFNTKIHFWLNHLEEATTVSTPVYTNGASGARVQSRVSTLDLPASFGDAYNQAQGTFAAIVRIPSVTGADMTVGSFSDGTVNNVIGVKFHTDGFVRPSVTAASVAQAAESVSRLIQERDFPVGITWGGGTYKVISGAGRTRRETGKTLPTVPFTRFDLGSRHSGSSGFTGGIKKIVVANYQMTNTQLGELLIPDGGRSVISIGQSLIDNFRRSNVDVGNSGEVSFLSQLDSTWSATAGKNWLLHGAIGGAGILYHNTTGGPWYYNEATDEWGDAWQHTQDVLDFFLGAGGTVEGIVFDGAQQDAGARDLLGAAYTEVYDGILKIVTKIRGIVGSDIPLVIMPTVGRTGTGLYARYQYLRELEWDFAENELNTYRGPETFDLEKGDAVHLTAAGYTTSALRSSRKILDVLGETITGGVDGAAITGAVRIGTAVTVTLAHDTGTNFTPTTGIEGFYYVDGSGTQVAITAAVRASSTTITLTLASGVAGTLYNGYGWLQGVDYANLVKDNATIPMPLRGYKAAVA